MLYNNEMARMWQVGVMLCWSDVWINNLYMIHTVEKNNVRVMSGMPSSPCIHGARRSFVYVTYYRYLHI